MKRKRSEMREREAGEPGGDGVSGEISVARRNTGADRSHFPESFSHFWRRFQMNDYESSE